MLASVGLFAALPGAAEADPGERTVAGECDLALVVDRGLHSYELSTPEEPAECTTTDGAGTLELSGVVEGVPGLTCAGGVARGAASLTFTTPAGVTETDVLDLTVVNAAGPVLLHGAAINAFVDVQIAGTLLQSHNAASTCLNQPPQVRWFGRVVVAAEALH